VASDALDVPVDPVTPVAPLVLLIVAVVAAAAVLGWASYRLRAKTPATALHGE
jgi:hypothetical protein